MDHKWSRTKASVSIDGFEPSLAWHLWGSAEIALPLPNHGHRPGYDLTVTNHDVGQTTFQIFNCRPARVAIISEATVISNRLLRGIPVQRTPKTKAGNMTKSTVIQVTTRFQIIRRWSAHWLISMMQMIIKVMLKARCVLVGSRVLIPTWRLMSLSAELGLATSSTTFNHAAIMYGPKEGSRSVMVFADFLFKNSA